MLMPMIGGSNLVLYSGTADAYIVNNILKVFLIIGGAWAIYKSQHLILQIISPEAAWAAKESSIVTTALLMGVGSGGFKWGKLALGGSMGGGAKNEGGAVKKNQPEDTGHMEDMNYDQAFRGR